MIVQKCRSFALCTSRLAYVFTFASGRDSGRSLLLTVAGGPEANWAIFGIHRPVLPVEDTRDTQISGSATVMAAAKNGAPCEAALLISFSSTDRGFGIVNQKATPVRAHSRRSNKSVSV